MKLDETRPEVKAWIDLIGLRNIPVNNEEKNRLIALEKQWALDEIALKTRKTSKFFKKEKQITEDSDITSPNG